MFGTDEMQAIRSVSILAGALVVAVILLDSPVMADPVQCENDEAVAEKLAATIKAHADAHLVADSVAAIELYLDDIRVIFEGVEYRSKAAMQELYESYYADYVFKSLDYFDHNVWVCGDTAYTYTSDEGTLVAKSDGEESVLTTMFMVTWKLQTDEEWKVSAIVEVPKYSD